MTMLGFDKLLHLAAGFFIYTLTAILASYFIIDLPSYLILLIVVIAGVGKEVFDKLNNQDVEFADVIATMLGGVLGMMLMDVFIL